MTDRRKVQRRHEASLLAALIFGVTAILGLAYFAAGWLIAAAVTVWLAGIVFAVSLCKAAARGDEAADERRAREELGYSPSRRLSR